MNDKNTKKLFKQFKFLNKKNLETIDINDGWYKLIYNMCKELKTNIPPDNFIITYIGEKDGGLRVHSKNGIMKTRVIIDEFNTASLVICSSCGNDRELEKCDKCTEPVIEETEEEEKDSDECESCSTNPCGC